MISVIYCAVFRKTGYHSEKIQRLIEYRSSTIGGYVQNSSEPDFETLKRLAKYFDVTTDYLLDYHSGKTATQGRR